MMRAALPLAALALLASCGQSEHDRVRDARERTVANASVARSEVVRSSRSLQGAGSIIYDKPVDLSYATLRKTRPDLDSAARGGDSASARRLPGAIRPRSRRQSGPLDANIYNGLRNLYRVDIRELRADDGSGVAASDSAHHT